MYAGGNRYAYWWVDGVYTNLRAEGDPRICLLVIIGVAEVHEGAVPRASQAICCAV